MKERHFAIIDRDNPRVKGFISYLEGRGVTERGINNILSFAANYRVNVYLNEVAPKAFSVFDITNVELLTYVYKMIRDDEDNIRLHRIYSGAVNRYIEFLSGKRVGRIDERKKKGK
jgi:hypothetical protein